MYCTSVVCEVRSPPGSRCTTMLVHEVVQSGGKMVERTPCTAARHYVRSISCGII